MSKSFYITTTLPYVNADPHVGFAMEFIRADTIARYKKLLGYDVFFNTGTDEHGQKLFTAAEKEGIPVQQYVDDYAERFRGLKDLLGITYDVHFIRTTDVHHVASVQEFWNRCNNNGYIYKKNYEIKYCIGCELEKTDSELNDNGECPVHPGVVVEKINEENYFFKFSEFGDKLLKLYSEDQTFITPIFRLNEMKSFINSGLQDFSISRLKSKMPWGVPVPNDEEQIMYVWFDALVNYISTLGWPEDTTTFEKFWINGTPVQYCGKDNVRQQSVMWQAMLMAAGLPNSHKIVINGFITAEGGVKMSKSVGNVFSPYDIVAEYGADALRYFLLREVSSFEDSPFTIERFKNAYNSGLANGLGNLVSRIMTMAENYGVSHIGSIITNNEDTDLNSFDIKKYMDKIWLKIEDIDKKIQKTEPYKLFKTDEEMARGIVSELCTDLSVVATLLIPALPETANKILTYLKQSKKPAEPLFLRKD